MFKARRLIIAHLLLFAAPVQIMANYTFLGQLNSYQRTESGLLLTCEDDVQLRIEFLTPEMFRVILERPGYPNDLLEAPLVKTDWEAVRLEFGEHDTHLILSSAKVDLVIQKMPCRLAVLDKQGRVISSDDPGLGIGWDGNEVRCWKSLAEDQHFFGLGEKTGDLDKRGREWVMWNSDTPDYDNQTDPLYQSVPFFITFRHNEAHGIYLNNSYRSVFNMGAGNRRYYSFAADGGVLDYFFIYGPAISQVISCFTELTGHPPLPPRWALGYQQSRWSYASASDVRLLARSFREKQIPADVIYLDIDYMDQFKVFTWNSKTFPRPAKLMEELRQMGFRVVPIIDPGVKADSQYSVAREGVEGGYFLRYPDGELYTGEVWAGPSFFPDFSQKDARNWWGARLAGMLDLGADGFWNDMNEPSVWGKAFPLEVLMDDRGRQSSLKKMHNLYGFLMAQVGYETQRRHQPGRRPFQLNRAGFAGLQRYAAVWTGDNHASWEHLELGIRMMLGLSLSGMPFVGTDVGGFIGDPSPELFVRWMQVGAFSPFFRNHSAKNTRQQEPWSFGKEVEQICRQTIEQRYRLMPYLYTLFWEASESGAPIIRPLFWFFPEDTLAYDRRFQHQFFFGENLLVCPVTRPGQRILPVYLPAGQWLEMGSGRLFEGPSEYLIETRPDRLPVFLRGGAILPTQPLRQFTDEPVSGDLTLEILPTTAYGNFMLYEDDGQSFGYEQGRYRLSQFEFVTQRDNLVFTQNRPHDQFLPPERMLQIRFHRIAASPRRVLLGKEALSPLPEGAENVAGFRYDPDSEILEVRIPDAADGRSLKIISK